MRYRYIFGFEFDIEFFWYRAYWLKSKNSRDIENSSYSNGWKMKIESGETFTFVDKFKLMSLGLI